MIFRKLRRVGMASVFAAALAMCLGAGGGVASADTTEALSEGPTATYASAYPNNNYSNYLKTYGVRAGSAGPDFLGITNTNYDFTAGSANSDEQYTPTYAYAQSRAGMYIWATAVNENPNPYYWNYYYNLRNNASTAPAATTWMRNDSDHTSSWGDTYGIYNASFGVANGLEYRPEIIFGANKHTNWNNFSVTATHFPTYIGYLNDGKYGVGYTVDEDATAAFAQSGDSTYNPTYMNNDATNLWTQIYTMGQLATTADSVKGDKQVRYESNSATTAAVNYEKALRGNLQYCASQLTSSNKKTIAYLYAIDGTNNMAYFFCPEADSMVQGSDTGKSTGNSESNPNSNYAANNGTINLGYMETLPFITNTYKSNNTMTFKMKVEDIWKNSPVCKLAANTSGALSNVDVIIYNTSNADTLIGTSGGRNSSAVDNTGVFANGLPYAELGDSNDDNSPDRYLSAWLAGCGFKGTLIAGDDFGTSTNQDRENIATTDYTYTYTVDNVNYTITGIAGQAPLLYCQRNYTCDKNARAAWAFSQVYPEFYGSNRDASYGYWVNKVYHVKLTGTDNEVPGVVAKLTGKTAPSVTFNATTVSDMEGRFTTGYSWWSTTGSASTAFGGYDYYTGSSRASYYDGLSNSQESGDTIGIFAPSDLWE